MASKTPDKKPAALGTVWTAIAAIKVIDESKNPPEWKTLATCMDTPNSVAARVADIRAEHATEVLSIWVFHQYGSKEYLGQTNNRPQQ